MPAVIACEPVASGRARTAGVPLERVARLLAAVLLLGSVLLLVVLVGQSAAGAGELGMPAGAPVGTDAAATGIPLRSPAAGRPSEAGAEPASRLSAWSRAMTRARTVLSAGDPRVPAAVMATGWDPPGTGVRVADARTPPASGTPGPSRHTSTGTAPDLRMPPRERSDLLGTPPGASNGDGGGEPGDGRSPASGRAAAPGPAVPAAAPLVGEPEKIDYAKAA